MQLLFLDYETYYDDEYSLRKMTPAEYIADIRFEALGCSFVPQDGAPFFIEGPDLPQYFASVNWDDIFAVSHNALFDMLIMTMRYGVHPRMYGDTMAMARNWISHSTGKVSLDACAKYYGLDAKWQTLSKTKGINYLALTRDVALHKEVRDYAIDDVLKCQTIFERMIADGFPHAELETIDMVIRMAAEPQFEIDLPVAVEHLSWVRSEKQKLLDRVNMDDRANLMSDAAFVGLLVNTDPSITIPRKTSKATGKEMFALAKTDKEFTALLEHDNPEIQALVAARLGHKSTLEETRTERFINIGRSCEKFPIPLKYSGAHTHRFSGDWSINAQNLPVRGENTTLRKSLKAPAGKKVVSVDASQIEARINATLSGQWDLVEAFRQGRDVYCDFASYVYHCEVVRSMGLERFVGKTSILSLGYSSGPPVFQAMLRNQGGVDFTLEEATTVVGIYRNTYKNIVNNWYYVSREIMPIIEGLKDFGESFRYGPVKVMKEKIILPNGNRLQYRDMHTEQYVNVHGKVTNGQVFMRGQRRIYTYGAKIVENIVQALAFVHIMEVAKRVCKLTDGLLPLAHQVHDELIYIVDDHLALSVGSLVKQEMATTPEWMPELPLAAEYKIGASYGNMKAIR